MAGLHRQHPRAGGTPVRVIRKYNCGVLDVARLRRLVVEILAAPGPAKATTTKVGEVACKR